MGAQLPANISHRKHLQKVGCYDCCLLLKLYI
jgi:hypothetical protein